MKLYKDLSGNFWHNDTIVLAGNYKLKVNDLKTEISIYTFNRDLNDSLGALYNIPVIELQKEDGSNYASYEEFYSEMAGLFNSNTSSGVASIEAGVTEPYKVTEAEVDFTNSDFTDWTGDVTAPFDGPFSTSITNNTGDNPKSIDIAFKYTLKSLQLGLGENNGGDFSNVKISLIGSGGVTRAIYDNSSDNTKLTSLNIEIENEVFNNIRIEFHTADPVSVSNILIYPSRYITAQIQGKAPTGEFVNFNASALGNFKVALAEYQGDAFGRLRVSEPYTIFDSSLTSQASDALFWSTLLNGTAFGTLNEDTSSYTLNVGQSGDYVIRQTKQRFKYQPGKSHEVLITGHLPTATNTIKRCGLLDYDNKNLASITNTPQNGVFFENNSGVLSYNIANNGVITESVAQANWNVDKCDGTGPSGFTFDPSSTNIFFMDLEWLGVGAVRCGFVGPNGTIIVAHQFQHASNGFSDVYMRTANLPVSYEITSTGGVGVMKQICSSVISEGGFNPKGIFRSVYTPASQSVIGNTLETMVGIRLKPEQFEYSVSIDSVSTLAESSGDGMWFLLYNPTYTGTPTWTDLKDSSVQYSTDNLDVTDENIIFASGTFSSDNDASSAAIESALRIGKDLQGNLDEVWLGIECYSNETVRGTIRFRETL